MLFNDPIPFEGLPERGFRTFAIEDRNLRRNSIIREIHPSLQSLGEWTKADLQPHSDRPFHVHLPRLDWPKGYQPFCTWLAFSHMAHGYQSSPQLNVGVHPDHVSMRLGWDTSAASFMRFEFLWQHSDVRRLLDKILENPAFSIRVYASAHWPEGSRKVFDDPRDVLASFRCVQERGIWWEVGIRLNYPEEKSRILAPGLAAEVAGVFRELLPLYERLT